MRHQKKTKRNKQTGPKESDKKDTKTTRGVRGSDNVETPILKAKSFSPNEILITPVPLAVNFNYLFSGLPSVRRMRWKIKRRRRRRRKTEGGEEKGKRKGEKEEKKKRDK